MITSEIIRALKAAQTTAVQQEIMLDGLRIQLASADGNVQQRLRDAATSARGLNEDLDALIGYFATAIEKGLGT